VRAAIADGVVFVTQEEARGTGHATRQAEAVLKGYQGPLVVAYSDLPLLRTGDIRALVRRHLESKAACTLLTAVFERPGTLGRIVRGGDGGVVGIVEARDATEEQLHIKEINVGVYCFQVLRQVRDNNAQRQYYLTDAIGILVERGERVEAVTMERAAAGIGVDTQEDLARAQALSGSDEEPG
jgi:bifunctional UDP-N-acetylglucosamine pyrophosphorylase/glucosamine-1-phosphate N-acetyltransferase